MLFINCSRSLTHTLLRGLNYAISSSWHCFRLKSILRHEKVNISETLFTGSSQCNSLPRDSNLSLPEEEPSGRKPVTKKRSFNFPSIHFSFPKFGGKRKPDVSDKDVATKGLSMEADVDVPFGGVDGAGDVEVKMVEEVQIQPQVKTAEVDIGDRLKGLRGLHNGQYGK